MNYILLSIFLWLKYCQYRPDADKLKDKYTKIRSFFYSEKLNTCSSKFITDDLLIKSNLRHVFKINKLTICK
jgi:hypothetical protein